MLQSLGWQCWMCIPGTGCVFLLCPCVASGLKAVHLFLSPLFGRCLVIEITNRPGRAQCFTGCGFILGFAWACYPPVTPHQGFRSAGGSQNFHRDPSTSIMLYRTSSALLCPRPAPVIATKADSRKAELQEKIVTSLPSVPRRPKPGLELYLWGFTVAVPGWGLPWMLAEDVSGWAQCSALLPVHSQETFP